MNHLVTWLLAAVLLALIAAIIWLLGRIIHGALPKSIRRRALHWMVFLFAGTGLLLSAPPAMARSYIDPEPDEVAVVTCKLNDRDPDEVLRALARRDSHLFDELGEGCHKPATGVIGTTRSCKLFSTAAGASNCFSASTKTFAIFDPLNSTQRRELTQVWLDGKHIETIYIDRTHPAELLVMAAPETRTYTYKLKSTSDYSASYCPKSQYRTGEGTLNIANLSFFVVTVMNCTRTHVWLNDWAPLLN